MAKVIFEKPSHELLRELGMMSIDMHYHSCYSDSNTQIWQIIKSAKEKGIGVAITDHNEIAGSLEAAKNIEGVMIIPGIEVSCIDGPHILLYFYSFREMKEFYDKNVKPFKGKNPFMATSLRTSELINSAKRFNCIRVAAHPYGYLISNSGLSKAIKKTHVNEDVMRNIDGLEVICGGINRRLNEKAVEQAHFFNRAITGGTDGHSLFQLGNVLTISRAETKEEFLDNIRKKKNIVMGKEVPLVPKIVPMTTLIKTHAIDYAVPSIKLQSKLLYDRAKKLRGRMANRFSSTKVAKKINGMFKKDDDIFGMKK
jgi:DNA polymerase III alpha subunit